MSNQSGFVEPSPQLKAHEIAIETVSTLLAEQASWTPEERAYLLAVVAKYAAENSGELLAERTVGVSPVQGLFWLNARELATAAQQTSTVLADLIEHIRNLESRPS